MVGAKQNRFLNLTILAPAQGEVVIPVSCVEQGRWYDLSEVFCASPRVHFAAGRAAKVASVSECLAEGQGAVSDQSGVWSDIASKAERMNPNNSPPIPPGRDGTWGSSLGPRMEAVESAQAM